jgi:nucleotide-binding universal stress UspA family protein
MCDACHHHPGRRARWHPLLPSPAASTMGVMAQLATQCAQSPRRVADVESLRWLSDLSDTGPAREDAAERLHALLLRAARFEVARRQQAGRSRDDLAVQAADDALVAILGKAAGPVWETIIEIADSHDATTIVMGSRGVTGLRAMFLGSVSNAIVHHADRPTLIVRGPMVHA